eukprot:492112_1
MGNSVKLLHKRSYYEKTACNTRFQQKEMLITGYMRKIETLLINKIVPSDIGTTVINYYSSFRHIYYIDPDYNVFSAKIDSNNNHELYDAKQLHLSKYTHTNSIEDIGMFLQQNNNMNHDIIYTCGGIRQAENYEIAKIIETNPKNECSYMKINHNNDKISIHLLPSLPLEGIAGNCVLFDKQYGLLSIGGYTERNAVRPEDSLRFCEKIIYYKPCNKFYTVQTDSTNNTFANWKKFTNICENVCFASGIIINTIYTKKCFIQSSSHLNDNHCNMQSKMYVFDFSTNQWSKLNNMTFDFGFKSPGICYNKANDMIYVGSTCKTICYNITKNKSMSDLIATRYSSHGPYCMLWTNDKNNMLFSASGKYNNISFIDLRFKDKWKPLYGYKKKWNRLFGRIQTTGKWRRKLKNHRLLTCYTGSIVS